MFIYNSGKVLFLLAVQAFSRRPFAAKARVQPQVRPNGTYGGQSVTGTDFSGVISVCPVTIIAPKPKLRNHLNLHITLPRSIEGRSLGTFQKAIPIPKSGSIE